MKGALTGRGRYLAPLIPAEAAHLQLSLGHVIYATHGFTSNAANKSFSYSKFKQITSKGMIYKNPNLTQLYFRGAGKTGCVAFYSTTEKHRTGSCHTGTGPDGCCMHYYHCICSMWRSLLGATLWQLLC